MKRALVAGGAGFIGSHLTEFLLNKGYEVVVIDSLITGQKKNIEHLLDKKLTFLQANIAHPLKLEGQFDEIYDLASPASPVDFETIPIEILECASHGHRNLLELAKSQKARLLYASTSEVYGDPEVHPQKESYYGNVNTIGPRGCYDEAKRFGEALTMAYHRKFGLNTRIVRIFNTYGPRMRETDGRIIPNFFTQGLKNIPLTVYGDGSQTRSFCYVSDMCEGIYKLMQSNESLPVNVGNPVEKTVLEMAETVKKITGNTQQIVFKPLPENDPLKRRPDITRAKEILDWEPKVSLEDGLKETLSYFKKNFKA